MFTYDEKLENVSGEKRMPIIKGPDTGGSSNDEILFPTDQLRTAASKILAQISLSRNEHTTHWNAVQSYLTQSAPKHAHVTLPVVYGAGLMGGIPYSLDVTSYMKDLLDPHEERLRDTYDWLEKFVQALYDAIDQIEQTDTGIATNFDNYTNHRGFTP